MECRICHSKWETNGQFAATLASCPFCGADLNPKQEKQLFNNSKDALCFIASAYGVEVLLGKQIINYFPDIAPSLKNERELIKAVQQSGALDILSNNLQAAQSEKEIAVKQAVAKLPYYMNQVVAETIIREFAAALGWQLSNPVYEAQQQAAQQSVGRDTTTKTKKQPQVSLQSSRQPKPEHQASTDAAAEIVQGKRRNIQFGGYEWRVLDVQGDRALLITEDIIEKRPYNIQYKGVTWETCTLRQYLNGEFYNRFDDGCKKHIFLTKLKNPDTPIFETKGGNTTKDYIFLLSKDEADKYFNNDAEKVAKLGRTAWHWWLRSPGYGSSTAYYINHNGYDIYFYNVNRKDVGVRPALWLNLQASPKLPKQSTRKQSVSNNAVSQPKSQPQASPQPSPQPKPIPQASPKLPKQLTRKQSVSNNAVSQPKSQPQAIPQLSPQPKPEHQASTDAAAEIVQGKRRNIQFGGYEWRVLDVQGGRALLITEDIIEKRPYNEQRANVTWNICTLRKYLNGDFYNRFDDGCKTQILLTNLENTDNQGYGTKEGNDTKNYIFLLIIDEVEKHFSNDTKRVAKYCGTHAPWWLRSPGNNSSSASIVGNDGHVYYSSPVSNTGICVRPALWLNLQASPQSPQQPSQQQSIPNNNAVSQPKSQPQASPQPSPQSEPAHQTNTDAVLEILQGKRRNVQFGSYKWRVLDVQGKRKMKKALLITEEIIETRPYNVGFAPVTWDNCTLRKYLNGDFYNKFSNNEQSKILMTWNFNDCARHWNDDISYNTNDNVFLLSINEVNRYFSNDADRVAKHGGFAGNWWLRSTRSLYFTDRVFLSGAVLAGDSVSCPGGVRPALWLNLR